MPSIIEHEEDLAEQGYPGKFSNINADNSDHANGASNGHPKVGDISTNGSEPVKSSVAAPTNMAPLAYDATPIAVCGIGLRLPAGIKTPQDFWTFLENVSDARGPIPQSRYNASAFHDTNGKPASVPTEYGYFLDDELGALDTSLFPMQRAEVERINPEQRMLLEVTRECLEDAGETDWRGKPIGCYVGCFGEDWVEMAAREPQQWGQYRLTGIGDFVMSNRVSYEFNLQGPSVTIRTACSASLTALNDACIAIARGDCQSAVVSGTNLIMTPNMTTAMSEHGVLSKDGSCKTFSADANGYARGEAITAIYVKKLSDAIADGNPVRAVIRATAINSDGKTPGMSCPSTAAHETLMKRAYSVAGITDLSKTGFVECHGTGTPIGDPIETKAVARVFGQHGILITSVKPNVGHTEGASGLVSVIKCILALERRTIPPNIKLNKPNPAIPWAEGLSVPLKPTPWPLDRAERVSINSFGAGGANAHVILDSAASFGVSTQRHIEGLSSSSQLLVLSAASPKSLSSHLRNYRDFLEVHPDRTANIAFTLASKREHLPHRAYLLASSEGVHFQSEHAAPSPTPPVVMVFTGQGAQWAQMARELLKHSPVFLSTIQSLDASLKRLNSNEWDWSIEGELRKPPRRSRIHTAELAQPLCSALQIALVDTLRSLDIIPNAVIGHSSGEIGAAYAAGAITAEEAIYTAIYRGIVASSSPRKGGMAAIGLSWEDVQPFLAEEDNRVNVACENSPSSVTISGDVDRVEAVVAAIKEAKPNALARLLKVDQAYHSYHMAELSDAYQAKIKQHVAGATPKMPLFSTVKGRLLGEEDGPLDFKYWSSNLESPVRFKSAIEGVMSHFAGQDPLFLELGPHSALAGPIRQTLAAAGKPCSYVPAIIRDQNSYDSFLSAIGQLWAAHVPMSLNTLFPSGVCLPDLPRYPWNHEENFWFESRLSREHRLRQFPHHDLLGVKVLESSTIEPAWRNLLHLEHVPWVKEHCVGDDIVMPMVNYLAMAGEAIRQVSGVNLGFRARRVVIHVALVIPPSRPVELVTTLRRQRLTDQQDSQWWEFTISAHNGSLWTKHCQGLVAAETEPLPSGGLAAPQPRKLAKKYLVDFGKKGNVNLGPSFHQFDSVTTDTRSQRTVGTMYNGRLPDTSKYFIHPCLIDGLVQIAIFNQTDNHRRGFQKTLPIGMEDIRISKCASDFQFDITVENEHGGVPVNKVKGVTLDGTVVMSWSGLKLASTEHGSLNKGERMDLHSAARPIWGPDLDHLSLDGQAQHLEIADHDATKLQHLSNVCLRYLHQRLKDLPSEAGHLLQFREWIDGQLNTNFVERSTLLDVQRQVPTSAGSPVWPVSRALLAVCEKVELLMADEVCSFENLIDPELADQVHELLQGWDLRVLLQNLVHTRPRLRVLEIGSGRSRPSSYILERLRGPSGHQAYFEYVFASDYFIPEEDQIKQIPRLEYASLDLSKDLVEQGFETRRFDLILANAETASAVIETPLANLKTLMQPNACLVIRGAGLSASWAKLIMGTHPRWRHRLAEDSGRFDHQALQSSLSTIGLQDCVVKTDEGDLLAIARNAPSPAASQKLVHLLQRSDSAANTSLVTNLERAGYEVRPCTLEDDIPPGQDVLALLDEGTPFLDSSSPQNFSKLRHFLLRLKDTGVLWITRPTQISVLEPAYAQITGFARVVRTELLLDFVTCEVQDLNLESADVIKVWTAFIHRHDHEDEVLNPEYEYLIRDGVINVSRYYPFELSKEMLDERESERVVMEIETPGRLNTLRWVQNPEPIVLGPDEVEIEVYAVGLNFRDLLVAMRILDVGPQLLGLEGAGIVRKVGPRVTRVKPGDRVAALSYNSMFASLTTAVEAACVKIPDDWSFEDAAGVMLPWVTVLHSFETVANLKKDQSVLIHSACGGVGLAAVELALMMQADIYVTVGNEEKASFLMERYGIPRHRICSSRDDSFEADIMKQTSGRGVHVVLNSLSGELLHASWRCVAPFGKLVEIGKRDLIGNGKLDMDRFLANRSYCCVDVGVTAETRPTSIAGHVVTVGDWISEGTIKPPARVMPFNAASLSDAFRYLQPGTHIGRVVVVLREASSKFGLGASIALPAQKPRFDPTASYLLVGGLGGIGRAVSRWMVEHGARSLVYLSRSAGFGPDDQSFLEELATQDCDVQLVRGNVTNYDDVSRAFEAAPNPVRGIFQMSMVLRDQGLPKMTTEEWSETTAPKVQGTWNLHNASLEFASKLDFFVLFSSLSSTVGQHGQANYASANTFLDAFARYRQQLGLPASSINIGAVDDIGVIAENDELKQRMSTAGFIFVREQELLDALVLAVGLNNDRYTNFVLGLGSSIPLSSPTNHNLWKKDRRMAIYHNTSSAVDESAPTGASLLSYVASVKSDPSVLKDAEAPVFLAKEIGKVLCGLLLKPAENINVSMSLSDLGLDSLVGVELRTWWKRVFGSDVSVLEMLGAGTLEALGTLAVEGLLKNVSNDSAA